MPVATGLLQTQRFFKLHQKLIYFHPICFIFNK